ncbi:MAG: hypothetical protein ABIZ64_06740 [Casimicrobium sp.]
MRAALVATAPAPTFHDRIRFGCEYAAADAFDHRVRRWFVVALSLGIVGSVAIFLVALLLFIPGFMDRNQTQCQQHQKEYDDPEYDFSH